MKKIGILTSGGDSQGMNAAIYSTVKCALQKGLEVYGIYNGYQGLIDGKVEPLTVWDVENVAHRGGTLLGTARCPAMFTSQGQKKAIATLQKYGIEGLVVIGGDGSFNGAKVLTTKYGVNTVGIPGTIDNDLAYTDFTLGFDSATATVINAVKGLRDTMHCNERTFVVEVMGRNCGDIGLYASVACGAEVVLIPEVELNLDKVISTLKHNAKAGKHDNIVLVSEGVRINGEYISGKVADTIRDAILERMPKINIRSVVLGHLQRGGDATIQDTILGIRMGEHAVKCLTSGKTNRVIGIKNNKIFDEDIVEALSQQKEFNSKLYALSKTLVKY